VTGSEILFVLMRGCIIWLIPLLDWKLGLSPRRYVFFSGCTLGHLILSINYSARPDFIVWNPGDYAATSC